MPNPEQAGQLPPEQQAGLTPEQMALVQQGMDPALVQVQGQADMSPMAEQIDPYALPSSEQTSGDARAEAVAELAAYERAAIDAAPAAEWTDAFGRTEAAQKDKDVHDARKHIEEVFGDKAAEEAIKTGIETSKIETHDAEEIAKAVEGGKHELASSKESIDLANSNIDNTKTAKSGYNRLKDKINGRAGSVIEKTAERTNHRLMHFGIRGKRKDLGAEAVEAAGDRLADDGVNRETQRQLVGEAVISALVDNRPTMRGRERKELIDKLIADPAAAKQVGAAAYAYRHGARRLKSFDRAGKALEHLK